MSDAPLCTLPIEFYYCSSLYWSPQGQQFIFVLLWCHISFGWNWFDFVSTVRWPYFDLFVQTNITLLYHVIIEIKVLADILILNVESIAKFYSRRNWFLQQRTYMVFCCVSKPLREVVTQWERDCFSIEWLLGRISVESMFISMTSISKLRTFLNT